MKRVLVADDEPDIVDLVDAVLREHDCVVTTAANGQEALEQVADQRPDLILLDVAMPVLDGLQTLRRLKADPATADIPVALLTAHDEDADITAGYAAGADVYLKKPFVPIQLLALMELLPERDGVTSAA